MEKKQITVYKDLDIDSIIKDLNGVIYMMHYLKEGFEPFEIKNICYSLNDLISNLELNTIKNRTDE